MLRLARWFMVMCGLAVLVFWLYLAVRWMAPAAWWVSLGKVAAVCVGLVIGLVFLASGMLYRRAGVPPPKIPPARINTAPRVPQHCERCGVENPTLYSKKRDLLCCDPCAFAVTMPIDDLASVEAGLDIRAARTQAQRG